VKKYPKFKDNNDNVLEQLEQYIVKLAGEKEKHFKPVFKTENF
jgi:hypothetical protein